MRNLFIFMLICASAGTVFGQSWEDSLRLGKKYYQEKEFEKAYATLLEAQKLAPSNIDLSQDIGNAAYRIQDFEMAKKAYQAAANNNQNENLNAGHWHNLGNSQMKSKDYQSAVESYKESLRRNPDNKKTRYNLSEAQRRLKLQEESQNQKQNQENNQSDEDQQRKQGENQQNQADQNKQEGQESEERAQNESAGQSGEANQRDRQTPDAKLSNRKSERMLEELLKQEMKTKEKIRGMESRGEERNLKSGKRW